MLGTVCSSDEVGDSEPESIGEGDKGDGRASYWGTVSVKSISSGTGKALKVRSVKIGVSF